MRILFVNKYLYPKGGSETHLLSLARALDAAGHETLFFGMEHSANVTPPERTVTVPHTDFGSLPGWWARLKAGLDLLYSKRSHHLIREQARAGQPDVAHLHNIYHQLSPSVLVALGEAGVPSLLTAHDYKLVCPSYWLHDGYGDCFACRGHRYWNVVKHGCSRHGVVGDVTLAIEAYTHHFLRVYERHLGLVIAPSRFMHDRLVEGGFSPSHIRVLPNAIGLDGYEPRPEPGEYVLFVGRLSYEKGLPTLLDAARHLPDIPIWIAGDGPLLSTMEWLAESMRQVRFLGAQSPQSVRQLLGGCRMLVLPSDVPENCPMSVLEAFAASKPVVATRVGGVPELFEEPPAGLTVPPGDPDALAGAIRQLWDDADLCWHCGVNARRRVETHHDLAEYTRRIEAIYAELIDRGRTEAPAVEQPAESPLAPFADVSAYDPTDSSVALQSTSLCASTASALAEPDPCESR